MLLECLTLMACLMPSINSTIERPLTEHMPLSVTSYWFYNDDGEPVAWGGQANGDPTGYANTYPTDASHRDRVGACIDVWVYLRYTNEVIFTFNGQQFNIACYDAFGAESYRRPFFHGGYGMWVVPVDILSPVPYHGLAWDWQLETVRVGDLH